MDAPAGQRGNFYPTALTARCESYHQCLACKACNVYDETNIACTTCEGRKPQVLGPCRHGDDTQTNVRLLDKIMKMPMFDRDKKQPKTMQQDISSSEDWERIARNSVSVISEK